MDNAIVATHPHTHETAQPEEHAHVALPQHRHHFETEEQQREAGTFGMWLFLLTEIMFFGGLFFAYLLYRNWYYDAFVVGVEPAQHPAGRHEHRRADHLGLLHGAGGVGGRGQEEGAAGPDCLILTTLFGCVFIGIKYVEYHEKWEKHHIPGAHFDVSEFVNPHAYGLKEKPLPPDMAQKTQIFFSLYFAMTGHARAAHDHRPRHSRLAHHGERIEVTSRRGMSHL